MDLWFVKEGQAFTLYAIEGMGESLRDFLESLSENDPREHDAVWFRLDRLAEQGPVRRKSQFRAVGNGLFELKTRAGSRILFFYDSEAQRVIICTHGFAKGPKKTQTRLIEVGKKRKHAYEEARARGEQVNILLSESAEFPERIP